MQIIGFPRSYKQGFGIFSQLGKEAKRFGSNALVLVSKSVYKFYQDKIEKTCADYDLPFNVIIFKGECSPNQIATLTNQAKNFCNDVVIGIGGGKILDTAKAVAFELSIPVVIVPTIASNDAPTTRLIPTYEDNGSFIKTLNTEFNPDSVFVDTEIICEAPAHFFACGIADALATYYEALQGEKKGAPNCFGAKHTLLSHAIAKTCNDVIWEYAVQAYEDIKNKKCTDAVNKVIEANILLSGIGAEATSIAGAHGIGSALTHLAPKFGEAEHIMHGASVALGLIVQFALEGRKQQEVDKLHELYLKLDLPIHFSQIGVAELTEEKIQFLAKMACQPNNRIWNMSVNINEENVATAIRLAQAFGAKKLGL